MAAGSSIKVYVNPAAGYHIDKVLVDGAAVVLDEDDSYTFSAVTVNHTISASFALNTYTIVPTAGAGGSISPATTQTVLAAGSQTFTITSSAGYHISAVLVDGSSVGAVSTYTFSDVSKNHTIAATFALNTCTVTPSAGPGGTIAPATVWSMASGSSIKVYVTAATGYRIDKVLVDNVAVELEEDGAYTFSNVTTNHTISATFALMPPVVNFTITPTAGPNGSISPATAQTVASGEGKTFTITADSGYVIADVLVNGKSVGAVGTYEFTNVTADQSIEASFKKAAIVTVKTSLTIHRSVLTVKHGHQVTITGKLSGGLPAHTKITLRVSRGSGASSFTAYTSSTGAYSFKYTPKFTGRYAFQTKYAGKTGFTAATSSLLKITSK